MEADIVNKTRTTRSSNGRSRKSPVNRTIGPVANLEQHLPSEWWKTLFNSLYVKTDGDVVENPENTRREIDHLLGSTAMETNDRILDLCCGQGRHVLELARRGYRNVVGVDRSRYLIRLARKRARDEGFDVQFHEGDARKFIPPSAPFNSIILMGNSFGYFDQKADDRALLTHVAHLLMSQGVLYMDVVDGDWMREHFERRSWEWIDQEHFVCRERELSADKERIVTRELISHSEKGVIADQFYAERLYSISDLEFLLEDSGFRNVRYWGDQESLSTRDQDLGMMGRRIIFTAQAPTRKKKKLAQRGPRFTDITVVFGDPRLPDKVKVNGRFNPEDIDTVQRLKQSLGELDDYSFTYIDNHQSLISQLRANPPEFVFNLCDEGYYNDPFRELHVPALFEMLDIPYTGAGPACLGLCYNKNIIRSIAESMEIPVPMESYHGPDEPSTTIPALFPALVKPNYGDSSMGITQQAVVHNKMELVEYIAWLRSTIGPCPILVQEFLQGAEYSIGVIGNTGLTVKVLMPLEVDYSNLDPALPRILGYESKWYPDSPYWNQISYKPADLDEESQRKLTDYSRMLFDRLSCRDYARFDFRADSAGVIKLLEVNPNPGWCWDGKMNIMMGFEGFRYSDMLRMIIEAAQERYVVEPA